MLTFRGTPEDHLSDIRANQSAGCPVCGMNVCGDCSKAIEMVCDRCGGKLQANKFCKPTGDWRLPDRLRRIEGVDARLAELDKMRQEDVVWWKENHNEGVPRLFRRRADYWQMVIENDPRLDEVVLP